MIIEMEGIVKDVGPGWMKIAEKNVRYWILKNATIATIEKCPQLKAMKKDERKKLRGKNAKIIIQVGDDVE
ncbi:MAG: hypothetical protein QXE05_00015 [Nitrososphaeria archaeon]